MPRRSKLLLLLPVLGVASCVADGPSVAMSRAAIVNGTEVAPGELAAVGALLRGDNETVLCSATLIADRFALTAAHCLDRLASDDQVHFFVGTDARTAPPTQKTLVASRFAHPDYDGSSVPDTLALYHDIALLALAEPVAGVVPVRLVRPAERVELITPGRGVLLVGYGADVMGGQRGIKRRGTTTIGEVGEGEFWILGDPKPQKCSGDSGGPTLGDLDEGEGMDLRLTGVASRAGQDCSDGSAETRVDIHLEWIHDVVGDAMPCNSGASEDCPARGETALGEQCSLHHECRDGICVLLSSGQGYCSSPCDSVGGCEPGFRCDLQRGTCFRDDPGGDGAGVDADAGDDAGDAGSSDGGSGCSVGAPSSALWVLAFLLAGIWQRRKPLKY